MTLPVAIIGCGLVGAKRAAALAPDHRLVSVFDVDRARAEKLAAAYGAELAGALHEACERAAGGLAVVATAHDGLVPAASAALDAGCHVLVEKPGGRDHEEVARLSASAGDAVVRVGFNHRFHPAIRRMRDLLHRGEFGEILFVRGRYGHGGRLGYETEWRADRERSGGGELMDQGVHLIDLVRFLAGDASLVYSALDTLFWPMDVEDNAFLHLRLRSGGHAWLHTAWTEWKNLFSLEVACRTAKLEVNGLGGSYGPERLTLYRMGERMGPPEITTWEWPPGDESWRLELLDVGEAVAGRPAVGATLEDCLATLSLVQAAYAR